MDEKALFLKLIQWVCFAQRPMTLAELRWAMVADFSRKSLRACIDSADYIDDMDAIERRLRTLSHGLVEAIRTGRHARPNATPTRPRVRLLALEYGVFALEYGGDEDLWMFPLDEHDPDLRLEARKLETLEEA
ncbi:hypothetical protein B0T26DRAFT_675856 [Lasiosphaeria miniovina]|uniref:Uncharacterized protein n=1 Tax=Lasiosphaeria miniovina TaxID=1954250 RepID=A0AA40DV70_9PEZI|nr:uncharacterized protein B0T26DRAFT_675856 [Lasiosphaeria miniovina]KAK0717574.1 hypothetical protein B0T26DRAFT_675856 [Lasiosphaeria miniovina]